MIMVVIMISILMIVMIDQGEWWWNIQAAKQWVITVNIQCHNSPCDLTGIINLKENIDSSVLVGYIFR